MSKVTLTKRVGVAPNSDVVGTMEGGRNVIQNRRIDIGPQQRQ